METDVHKWLKEIGLRFLKEKGMDMVVREVQFKCGIADCCGLNFKRKEVRVLECKATKQDYVRDHKLFDLPKSYYAESHYFYIICPYGVIDKNLVQPGIGLIYVKDNDEYEIIKKPKKNTSRLKTLFDTTLRIAIRRLSNELYYKDEKEYKDITDQQYISKADIYLSAIRCPQCKHVTKELISKSKTKEVQCKHCKQMINIKNAKVRDITGYNQKFIDKLKQLQGD